ncbi:hypothetical protein AB1Y20_008413 [Prymnesium parvum]|uniref:Nucleotide-diphospho-sugar transferase domain-containing protein n=1 Tax=Prymnesium parvum TaxID=97485 RepID=A0AB34IRE3_PRYPA
MGEACAIPALAGLELTRELLRSHANRGIAIVTFTNAEGAPTALNWARALRSLGLRSLVGLTAPLRRAVLRELRDAGGAVFCADGVLAQLDSAAGRWERLAPLLRWGVDVLCSDADIAWLRDPLPYLRALKRRHPTLDVALASDRVTLQVSSKPLARRFFAGEGAGVATELDLEDALSFSVPSYNVGIVMLYASASAHAARAMSQMLVEWTTACITSPAGAKRVRLDPWAQGPINSKVLRRGITRDSRDPVLARVYGRTLALGVLPSLQFTTALTYFAFAPRRDELGVLPFCLHAIFSHGRNVAQKAWILRQANAWVDPPEYYTAGRFLEYTFESPDAAVRTEPPATAVRPTGAGKSCAADGGSESAGRGGYALIEAQLTALRAAARLAHALNRSLILPRLRCGDEVLAFPCYAWYHKMMLPASARLSLERLPMPQHCPLHYWLDVQAATEVGLRVREPSFLQNPRTPVDLVASRLELRLCASNGGRGGERGEGERSGSTEVTSGRQASLGEIVHSWAPHRDVRLLRVHGIEQLGASAGKAEAHGTHGREADAAGASAAGAAELLRMWRSLFPDHLPSRQYWCSACSVPGRAAKLVDLSPDGRREIEHFCKKQARATLDPRLPMVCCGGAATRGANHDQPYAAEDWRCSHPYCTHEYVKVCPKSSHDCIKQHRDKLRNYEALLVGP